MKYSLGFFLKTALVGITLTGYATATTAQTFRVHHPTVTEIEVACHVVNGEQYTVRIATLWDGFYNGYLTDTSPSETYRVVFQNVQNGSTAPLTLTPGMKVGPNPAWMYQFFNVPAGLYDVTVASIDRQRPGEVTIRGVNVPATVPTTGRGTGCQFLGDTRQRR